MNADGWCPPGWFRCFYCRLSYCERCAAGHFNEHATNRRAVGLCRRLLDPEDLGRAVPPHVRDEAREAIGLPAVEKGNSVDST